MVSFMATRIVGGVSFLAKLECRFEFAKRLLGGWPMGSVFQLFHTWKGCADMGSRVSIAESLSGVKTTLKRRCADGNDCLSELAGLIRWRAHPIMSPKGTECADERQRGSKRIWMWRSLVLLTR